MADYKPFSMRFGQQGSSNVVTQALPPLATLAVLAIPSIKTENPDPTAHRWQERWHEVRRIIVTKRDLDGPAASRAASEWLLTEWMNGYWEHQPDTAVCAHCQRRLAIDDRDPGLPFLNGDDGGHVWIHAGCHDDWSKACEMRARAALQSYGIEFLD
jgi:hypothetical protein